MEYPNVDYRRKWYVLAAVSMGIFLSTIDSSIVNVALPTLVRELNTDFATVQWVVLAYLLTVTTLLAALIGLGIFMTSANCSLVFVYCGPIFSMSS